MTVSVGLLLFPKKAVSFRSMLLSELQTPCFRFLRPASQENLELDKSKYLSSDAAAAVAEDARPLCVAVEDQTAPLDCKDGDGSSGGGREGEEEAVVMLEGGMPSLRTMEYRDKTVTDEV